MDRQYMPYFPPGSGRYPPQVKEEPDYSKMGYEDAPGGTFGIKREPGAGFEEPPGGFAANVKVEEPTIKQEFVEPKQEPSDERRGEKRQAVNQYGSPDPKRYRPELGKDHVEDEPEYDKTEVLLDWYNSDLSLKISKDNFLSAQPLTSDGFGYVWHGVRATYGFSHGRVFYEVKVEDHLPVPQLEVEEQHPHVMRCGWSIDDAGMTLGEEPFSYGYGGTAKASTALKFKDYGRPFGKGDVVGCFLDMDSEPIIISFTLNGRNLGMCYEVSHRSLQDKALFPHILTKNCSFKVNFGSEHPWFQPLTRYTFVGHIPLQERVVGTQGPETRQDSEVIMMVGLPACGKTTWIEKYCKENPAKKYYILGTNALIDKMKVNGLPRKRNYHGRWDVLIGKCTNCLNKLLDMSYKRRRNFIIDQTNVYPSARKRKMKGFPGFFRRAMVVCPDDAELKRRTDKQISQEGKNIPDSAIMEMKANFTLPEEEDDHFDSVEFTDLQREEAAKLVEQYSNDAQTAGFSKNRPPRGRGGANFRGGWNRDRRGGSNDRSDRSSSGSQDNRSSSNNRGGYSRDSFGGNSRGSDNSRGGFGRDNWSRDANRGGFGGRGGDSNRGGFGGRGGDSNRGGFGGRGGDSNRGGFGERGGDSNRGGFGERGGDSNRGGFGERGSFGGGNRDRDNRDFGRDNGSSHRGYGRDSYGGNDRNTQSSRDNNSYGGGFGQSNFGGSRDSQRGFDSNRSRFSTESFSGNSRGGFGQDNLGGNRDMQQGFESNRGGFGQESLGGNRDMQRGFNVDSRDNRGSSNSHGGYIRDNYGGSNKDLDRGYNNMDNRDNTNGGSDARGGFNRDSQRSMDRDYSRSGSDSWGGFSATTRSFSSDRDRDSRGDGDSRGGYSRDSYGGSSREGQRGYGSYDSSRSAGATRGGQDHSDSSGYSSLSSSTSSLSSGSSWNRQYSQQQYWGQSDGGYGSQQSSGSSQQSYARSSDRSSPGGGSGSGGGAGAAAAAAAGGGGGGGGWQQGNSGNWGGGSGSGNPQWNYSSSYRGQRQ